MPNDFPTPLTKALDDTLSPIVSAMITLLLAAPGLISEEMGKKCKQELLREGLLQPAGHGGRFTWDGYENAITKSPLWPNSYTWIDYVLWVRGSSEAPIYMDNRAIRLGSDVAFPELSVAYTKKCGEAAVKLRREALAKLGLCSDKLLPCAPDGTGDLPHHYFRLVNRIRESLNAKGEDGMPLSDEDLLGKELFKILRDSSEGALTRAFHSLTKRGKKDILEIMDPMLAPLLSEASDHYAVLSYIKLPMPSLSRSRTSFTKGFGGFEGSSSPWRASPSYERGILWSPPPAPYEAFQTPTRVPRTVPDSSAAWRDVEKGDWKVSRPPPKDLLRSADTIRILSQNLHFRPYIMADVTNHCGSVATDGTYSVPNLVANNMQELRARVFVNALLKMRDDEFPHVLCLQETQNDGANEILNTELHKSGRFKSFITSLGAKSKPGRGDESFNQETLWSGLQLWSSWEVIEDSHFIRFSNDVVSQITEKVFPRSIASKISNITSPILAQTYGAIRNPVRTGKQVVEGLAHPLRSLSFIKKGACRFSDRMFGTCFADKPPTHKTPDGTWSAGTDVFAMNKGILWVLLKEHAAADARRIQVIIAHPSPYVKLPGGALNSDVSTVPFVHRQQINMIREFIAELSKDPRLAGVPLFITGDLNINKYAVKPDSDNEKNVESASRGRSREFDEVLRKLKAAPPSFVADENTDRWVPSDRLQAAKYIERFLRKDLDAERVGSRTATASLGPASSHKAGSIKTRSATSEARERSASARVQAKAEKAAEEAVRSKEQEAKEKLETESHRRYAEMHLALRQQRIEGNKLRTRKSSWDDHLARAQKVALDELYRTKTRRPETLAETVAFNRKKKELLEAVELEEMAKTL